MKSRVLATALLFLYITSFSQTDGMKNDASKRIHVSDWRQVTFMFSPGYWEGKKVEELTSQLGRAEFEKVKIYSDHVNIPCQFLLFCENRDGSALKNLDTLHMKLSKLNVYRVAIFHHTNYQNTTFKFALLHVPYLKNKDWDLDAKWDTVYFVIDNALVEPID
jgi:hypothetical protein